MSDILPFGSSADAGTTDGENSDSLNVIKAFGCTVIDFNISADWGGQSGSLDINLIEDEADGDRLSIPVIGSPFLFEVTKNVSGGGTEVVFEHIGIVESFSRSASPTTKTYSVSISSPLKILEATKVIMNGFTGLGGSLEGDQTFTSYGNIDFGSRNDQIQVLSDDIQDYDSHWFNVSNIINAFGILENDSEYYRVVYDSNGNIDKFGDFGYSAVSADGMPLVKLMWALHMGINNSPKLSDEQRQQTHGGNLLYGRHDYDINANKRAIPYFYDFDALGFYNQIKDKLGAQYRVPGEVSSLNEIISLLCSEANFDYLIYIDINKTAGIGGQTLREDDPNWSQPSNCSWRGLNENKFIDGGNYGGTIRVKTIDKNTFFNSRRPFSNISYNILGVEVPDLLQSEFTSASSVHPGKRPGQPEYGFSNNSGTYMDPLDSEGLNSPLDGFTEVGTSSLANGGNFPTTTGLFDNSKMSDLKIVNSNLSLSAAEVVTMKVVTGGYQSRIVSVPRSLIKHYWGDIQLIGSAQDPREVNDTETDSFGLSETSIRKVPVVTQLLDPRDVDDFIFIDMQSVFGNISIDNVLNNGIYAASMYEIRCAMAGLDTWKTFLAEVKQDKYTNLKDYFFPDCEKGNSLISRRRAARRARNKNGGLGAKGVAGKRGGSSPHTKANTAVEISTPSLDAAGDFLDTIFASGTGILSLTLNQCFAADTRLKANLLPTMHEKIAAIGNEHYGKSWYVPVPYFKTKYDFDGENLVGNFTRSWNLDSSAYVEPSLYYSGEIPQTNQFIQDGKVSNFVNYDNDFVYSNSNKFFDDTYVTDLESPVKILGDPTQTYNFSEYSLDRLATTKYGQRTITHAAPEEVNNEYSFLPYAYESFYNREIIPYTDLWNGLIRTYSPMLNDFAIGAVVDPHGQRSTNSDPKLRRNPQAGDLGAGTTGDFIQVTRDAVFTALNNITSLSYSDNGEFCFPFVKVRTSKVFFPILSNGSHFNYTNSLAGYKAFQAWIQATGNKAMPSINESPIFTRLKPAPACIAPRSINYAQRSTRYVYGPWITKVDEIPYRGNVEYEQDDSLVPENFLIPLNFGEFGDFTLSQTSGLTGLDLAAQGRANAIDDFALFAQEQGSITIQSPPQVQRIGDSLYDIQNVTDLRVSVNNNSISTTYSFKTISPRFGKNNKDIEKKLTRISNMVKKLRLK
jgi:hypothetical protein